MGPLGACSRPFNREFRRGLLLLVCVPCAHKGVVALGRGRSRPQPEFRRNPRPSAGSRVVVLTRVHARAIPIHDPGAGSCGQRKGLGLNPAQRHRTAALLKASGYEDGPALTVQSTDGDIPHGRELSFAWLAGTVMTGLTSVLLM